MFLAAPRGPHARSAATAPASLREFKERANLAGLRASLLFPTDCRLVVICDIYQDRDQLLQRFFTCLRAQRSANLCPVALCFKSASLSLAGLARVRPRAAPPPPSPPKTFKCQWVKTETSGTMWSGGNPGRMQRQSAVGSDAGSKKESSRVACMNEVPLCHFEPPCV